MTDLNLLKTFMTVADSGSLTKASKLLKRPKSKISRDLSKLEDELEQSLLNRSPKGATLTEQGFLLLQSIRSSLDELENSVHQIQNKSNEIKGSIKITASEDLCHFILTRLVSEFMETHPNVSIELYSTGEFLDFQKYNIDLALRIGKLDNSSLKQRKISDIDVIYVASKYYAKSNPDIQSLQDLNSHSVGLIKDLYGSSLNQKILKDFRPKISSNSMSVLKDFVNLNKGIATLPRFLCQAEIQSKKFKHLLPGEIYLKRGLYLLSQTQNYPPAHIKKFKDYVFNGIRSHL